jgi:hypothetical protein
VGSSISQKNLKAARLGSIVTRWLSEGTTDCETTTLCDVALMTHAVNLLFVVSHKQTDQRSA